MKQKEKLENIMDDQNQAQLNDQQQMQQVQPQQQDPSMQSQQQPDQTQGQDQMQQQSQPQQPAEVQSGGGTPEAAPIPVQPEAQPQQVESGYEKIKQIEKAAEGEGQKEATPRQQQQRPPQKSKLTPKSIEKKEPPVAKPKYFGYQPPPSLANNTNYIKQNAGRGNAKDSQTWLLLFLDRLLKKEGETK